MVFSHRPVFSTKEIATHPTVVNLYQFHTLTEPHSSFLGREEGTMIARQAKSSRRRRGLGTCQVLVDCAETGVGTVHGFGRPVSWYRNGTVPTLILARRIVLMWLLVADTILTSFANIHIVSFILMLIDVSSRTPSIRRWRLHG